MKFTIITITLIGAFTYTALGSPVAQSSNPNLNSLFSENTLLPELDPNYLLNGVYSDFDDTNLETPNANITSRADTFKCETSPGSPRLHEVDIAANNLRIQNARNCGNTNTKGNRCTLRATSKHGGQTHAAISVCGVTSWLNCIYAANYVMTLKERCKKNNMWSGGIMYTLGGSQTIVLHK